jgi:hypothetical protein
VAPPAELLGKDGKPVAVAGETRIALQELSGTSNENHRIDNVPPGAYTLRISGLGIETLLKENVVVPKGGSTSVQAEVMPVAAVTIHVKNLDNDVLANSKVTFEALDAKGQPLELPKCKLVFLPPGPGRCEISLPHVPLACTRVRLKVEGYKAIELDVADDQNMRVGRDIELVKG